MAWRHVMITQPARLSVKNSQLVIDTENSVTIPMQDIVSILIEHPAVNLSVSVLSKCAEFHVSLISCDSKRLPNGIWTGYQQHYRQSAVLKLQLDMSKPVKKQIWQQVVQQKILNQALCLSYLNKEGESELTHIMKTVESGDRTNREAYAAMQYFKYLFDGQFIRRSDDPTNWQLNYGYAIMRGAVARSLSNYGFTTCFGLSHDNQLNSFNLADDLMEVFRPVVDLHVVKQDTEDWNSQIRADLVNLLNMDMSVNGERRSVTIAIDDTVKSFSSCCREKSSTYLKLPSLLPLRVHEYE
jgi:CRISPR-associated protein Cas1